MLGVVYARRLLSLACFRKGTFTNDGVVTPNLLGGSEEVVWVPLEGHSGLEQMRANESKLERTDLEIFRVI